MAATFNVSNFTFLSQFNFLPPSGKLSILLKTFLFLRNVLCLPNTTLKRKVIFVIQKHITLIQNLLQERTKKASQVLLPCQYHHQDRIKEEYGGEVDEVDEEDDVDHPPHPRSPPWRCCENTGVELPVYSGTELYCCVRSEPVNNTRNTFFFKFI